MTDETQTAGRVGPHLESHEPRLMLHTMLTDGVTPISGPLAWDGTGSVGQHWGMDNNDRLGCCGFAAWDHANVSKLGDATQAGWSFFPKFQSLADAYFAYGIAQGEPGPQPDQGVSNALMLAWGYQQGLLDWTDGDGVTHQGGYAEVPLNMLDWFAQQFKGAIIGLVIDGQTASDDFESTPRRPWDAMANPRDGHDVLLIKSDLDGSGALITWGGVQPFTAAFRATNITDAWVIFDMDDAFVNRDALEQALLAVHGVVDVPAAAASDATDSRDRANEG